MGAWGEKPFANDAACDWLDSKIGYVCIAAIEDDSERPEVRLAAIETMRALNLLYSLPNCDAAFKAIEKYDRESGWVDPPKRRRVISNLKKVVDRATS